MSSAAPLDSLVRRWRADPMAFRREAILMEDGAPFGDVIEDWQSEDFAALDGGQHRHAYLERPRGHAKTFDLGTEAVKELLLGRSGQRLYCAAADEDQARLLFDDVREKFERNPLLRGSVKVMSREVVVQATGSRLRVLASDAPSAYGLRPDWIAVDELAEWRRRELWDSLWTATGKRPQCRMLVISTAGWDRTSIAWEVRQNAEREADWYFMSRGQCASWVSKSWLAQQERTLPRHVYLRLHENQWVEGAGAFLTFDEVAGVFADDVPAGGQAAVGVDLGIAHDRSVVAVARRAGDSVVVELLRTWEGSKSRRVALEEVEGAVMELARERSAPVVVDPWQAVLLAQRLRARGVAVIEYAFGSESRRRLFAVLLELVRTGRLRSRPHEEFKRELLGLEISDTSSGWRVDHRPGRHDDHIVAVGLAAQHLASRASGPLAVSWVDAGSTSPGWHRVGGLSSDDGD